MTPLTAFYSKETNHPLLCLFVGCLIGEIVFVCHAGLYGKSGVVVGGDLGPIFCNTCGNLRDNIKQVRKCPLFRLIL